MISGLRLNEYLLGHIFEESLSDLRDLGATSTALLEEKLRERKSHGIFFTNSIIADFLCAHALQTTLNEVAPLAGESSEQLTAALRNRIDHLRKLQAADFACGSGVFLTSLYREMLQELYRLQSSVAAMEGERSGLEHPLFVPFPLLSKSGNCRDVCTALIYCHKRQKSLSWRFGCGLREKTRKY